MLLICRCGFYIALLAISWLALAPQDEVFVSTGWDKANHLLAFFVLCGLLDLSYRDLSLWRWKLPLLFVYGLSLELLQGVLPERSMSLLDLLADALGLGLYALLRPWLPLGWRWCSRKPAPRG